MRSKKALALLLAASMIFTLNGVAFAGEGVKAAAEESTTEGSQSVNSGNGKEQAKISDKYNTDTKITNDTLEKIAGNDGVKIELKEVTIDMPKAVLLDLIEKADNRDVNISTSNREATDDDKSSVAEKGLSANKVTQLFVLNIGITNDSDDDSDDAGEQSDGYALYTSFPEPVGLSVTTVPDTEKLGTAFVYCTSSDLLESMGSDSKLTDHTVDWTTSHASTFVFSSEAEAQGKNIVKFRTDCGLLVSGNDMYKAKSASFEDEDGKSIDSNYNEDYPFTGIAKIANAQNNFTVEAPYIYYSKESSYSSDEGYSDVSVTKYKVVGWTEIEGDKIQGDGKNNIAFVKKDAKSAAQGASLTVDKVYGAEENDETILYPIVEELNAISTKTLSANGHKIEVDLLETPAYTGKKIGADAIGGLRIDGQPIDTSLVKVKAKGGKTVGSEVEIIIKSIKGLDKDTNNELKNQSLGKVKIRPIEASETGLWTKYFDGEGKMLLTFKKGTLKKVKAIVPTGKRKFDKSKGDVQKARKLTIKKGFEYNSNTNRVTFDGSMVNGTIKVKVRSK